MKEVSLKTKKNELINENYMYDLMMEEIASYTERSIATFKRDFAKPRRNGLLINACR